MHIYLIGMPGAGKSTLGPALATQLGRKFLDLDIEIEKATGQTISRIFEKYGEAESLKMVSLSNENLVIATGGGTPCFHDNLAFMNAKGTTVYLKVLPEILTERLLQTDLTNRPLFKGKNKPLVLRYLQETLRMRATFYEQAGIIFESRSNPASIAEETAALLALIRRYEQTA